MMSHDAPLPFAPLPAKSPDRRASGLVRYASAHNHRADGRKSRTNGHKKPASGHKRSASGRKKSASGLKNGAGGHWRGRFGRSDCATPRWRSVRRDFFGTGVARTGPAARRNAGKAGSAHFIGFSRSCRVLSDRYASRTPAAPMHVSARPRRRFVSRRVEARGPWAREPARQGRPRWPRFRLRPARRSSSGARRMHRSSPPTRPRSA